MQSQALISHVALHCGQEKASHDEKNNRHECTKYHISDSSDTKKFQRAKYEVLSWVVPVRQALVKGACSRRERQNWTKDGV